MSDNPRGRSASKELQSEAYDLIGRYGDHAPIIAAMSLLETQEDGDAEAEQRWSEILDFMGEVLAGSGDTV